MTTKKQTSYFVFILACVLMVCLSACAKNPGVPGGNFAEKSSLTVALNTEGNTTLTLTNDETMDLTGININGRKEVFLNDHTLKLTGQYAISTEGVLDIKPGEGFSDGIIDLSELSFDTAKAPADAIGLSLIEIRSGIAIIEPKKAENIVVQEFPDTLTAIMFNSAD